MLDAVREAIGQPDLAYDWPLDRVRELCHQHGVATEPGWATGKLVRSCTRSTPSTGSPAHLRTDYPVEVRLWPTRTRQPVRHRGLS